MRDNRHKKKTVNILYMWIKYLSRLHLKTNKQTNKNLLLGRQNRMQTNDSG